MSDSAAKLPHFSVASESSGGNVAFDAFQQSIVDIFTLTRLGHRTGDDYRMAMIAWHLGTLMMSRVWSDPLRFARPRDLVATGGLDHLLVQLYLEGGFVGDADGAPVTIGAGEIVVFDLARPLHTESTAFANITLLIPRAHFEAAVDDVGALHGAVLPRESPMAGVLATYMVTLAQRMPELPQREAEAAAHATVALVTTVLARCARLPLHVDTDAIASPFRRAASFVGERLRNPELDAAAIATGLGMSRATLYRVFAPVGGVADYIRRRRLTAAAVDLSAPENSRRTVAEIAYQAGFASEATFNRAFRAAFGISPGAARGGKAAIWAVQGNGQVEDGPDEYMFGRWIRTLHA